MEKYDSRFCVIDVRSARICGGSVPSGISTLVSASDETEADGGAFSLSVISDDDDAATEVCESWGA